MSESRIMLIGETGCCSWETSGHIDNSKKNAIVAGFDSVFMEIYQSPGQQSVPNWCDDPKNELEPWLRRQTYYPALTCFCTIGCTRQFTVGRVMWVFGRVMYDWSQPEDDAP